MSAGAANERRGEEREIAYLAEPRRRMPAAYQFSLSTLLLLMTLAAVVIGLTVAIPPLGGWIIVVGSLALVRTIVECRRFLKDGRELLFSDKLVSFGSSLGYSFLAIVAALIMSGFLSMFAMGLTLLAQVIGDVVAGPSAAVYAGSVVGFGLILAVVAAAVATFISIYWRTISPRTTLDVPPPPHPVEESNAAL
jgi:hypothetical protein